MADDVHGQRVELILPTGQSGRTAGGGRWGAGRRLVGRRSTREAGTVGTPVPTNDGRPFLSTLAGRVTVVVGALVAVTILLAGLAVQRTVLAPDPIGIEESASGSGGALVRIGDGDVRDLEDEDGDGTFASRTGGTGSGD